MAYCEYPGCTNPICKWWLPYGFRPPQPSYGQKRSDPLVSKERTSEIKPEKLENSLECNPTEQEESR